MRTELDDEVLTEIGPTRVRTLSHFLLLKKPRTTIFSAANPYSEDMIVTIAWNTADAATLEQLHRRSVACISEHGFAPIKDASRLLHSSQDTKVTAGKVKLLTLLSPEVGAHVTFVG